MISPRVSLVELTQDVARRVIRHDMRLPITNIGRQIVAILGTFRDHPDTLKNVTNPARVIELANSIEPKTRGLYAEMSDLEHRLGRDASFTAFAAAAELRHHLNGTASKIEFACRDLASLLHGNADDLGSFGATALSNARLLSSKISALIAFFELDFARFGKTSIDLGRVAEEVALATFTAHDEPTRRGVISRHFTKTFSFSGSGEIHGNLPLIQAVFQNIYQNGLKYGRNTRDLLIHTKVTSGVFADLARDLSIAERPAASSAIWRRVDIANNGPPIPAKKKSTIFKLGKKFDVPGVEVADSFGLGMSICFIAATAHKGTISVDETSNDVRFVVLVPADERTGFSDTQLVKLAEEISIV